MNVKNIRRANLKLLAKETGNLCRLAAFLNKTPSFLSQIIGINAHKNVGDKLAAEIEEKFNMPEGWLDSCHETNELLESTSKLYYSNDLCTNIPLIQWNDIENFLGNDKKKIVSFVLPRKSPMGYFSKYAFALQIKDITMESTSGITFPQGAIIIVETEQELTDGSYVIVHSDKTREPLLRQYICEANTHRYLKPLNPQYPLIEYHNHYIIYGIVCMLFYEIKKRNVSF